MGGVFGLWVVLSGVLAIGFAAFNRAEAGAATVGEFLATCGDNTFAKGDDNACVFKLHLAMASAPSIDRGICAPHDPVTPPQCVCESVMHWMKSRSHQDVAVGDQRFVDVTVQAMKALWPSKGH